MKVLVAHGDLTAGGGAEAYAIGIIAALQRAGHQVGVLDIDGHLRADGTRSRPLIFTALLRVFGRRLALWKYAFVCRALVRIETEYDRVVLSYGEGPALTRPSVRILHAPALFDGKPALLAALGVSALAPRLWIRQFYAHLCSLVARPALDAPNVATVANSSWTAGMARSLAGMDAERVVYPGVMMRPNFSTAIKRDRFRILALGRIVANKRFEDAVTLVEQLNSAGLPARLQIVGRADTRYARRFLTRMQNHPLLILSPDADDQTLVRALAEARLGFHGYRNEHFGIAVGEMITAGVLPLVFDGGGVCELVPEPSLRFRDEEDAIAKAKAILLASNRDYSTLICKLQRTPALRAAHRFEEELDDLVAEHLRDG